MRRHANSLIKGWPNSRDNVLRFVETTPQAFVHSFSDSPVLLRWIRSRLPRIVVPMAL
jgi:hypothetical protein